MKLVEKKTGFRIDTGDSLGGDVFGYAMLFGPAVFRLWKKVMLWLVSARAYKVYKIVIPVCLFLELFTIVIGVARISDIGFFAWLFFFYWRSGKKAKALKTERQAKAGESAA